MSTPCERCDGYRWVYVSDSWVANVAPPAAEAELRMVQLRAVVAGLPYGTTPDPDVARELHAVEQKVAAARYKTAIARESVFPCPRCNTDQFERWSGGHYHPTHDPNECTECVANGWAGRKAKK